MSGCAVAHDLFAYEQEQDAEQARDLAVDALIDDLWQERSCSLCDRIEAGFKSVADQVRFRIWVETEGFGSGLEQSSIY